MTSRAEKAGGPRSISREETLDSSEARGRLATESPSGASASDVADDFRELYEKHVNFVWLTLQRLGVRPGDRDDLCHDVFLVAFKKLPTYSERSAARRWLFAICVRLAANHRRRARVRLERSVGSFDGTDAPAPAVAESSWPDAALGRQEAFERVHAILQRMQPLQRVVFVMFEVEGTPCDAIAADLGVALGTVYSRLHAARKTFQAEAERFAKLPKGQSDG
jgi:RNA polymerase sigma-70 factor (ECF subfamily)